MSFFIDISVLIIIIIIIATTSMAP